MKTKFGTTVLNESVDVYRLPNRISQYARELVTHFAKSDALMTSGMITESVVGVATGLRDFNFEKSGLNPKFFNTYKKEIMEAVGDVPYIKLNTVGSTPSIDGNVGTFVSGLTSYDTADDAKTGLLGIAKKIGTTLDTDAIEKIIVVVDGNATDLNGAVSLANPQPTQPKVVLTEELPASAPNVVVKPMTESAGLESDSVDGAIAYLQEDPSNISMVAGMITMLPKDISKELNDVLSLQTEAVGDDIKAQVDAVIKVIKDLVPKNFLTTIATAVVLAGAANVEAGLLGDVGKLTKGVGGAVNGLGTLAQTAGGAAQKVGATVQKGATALDKKVDNKLVSGLAKGVGSVSGGLGDVSGAAGNIVKGATNLTNKAANVVGNGMQTVDKSLANTKAGAAVSNVAKGVAAGAGAVGSGVAKGVGSVGSGISNTADALNNPTIDKEKGTQTFNFDKTSRDSAKAAAEVPDADGIVRDINGNVIDIVNSDTSSTTTQSNDSDDTSFIADDGGVIMYDLNKGMNPNLGKDMSAINKGWKK